MSFNLAPGLALGDAVDAVEQAGTDIGLPSSIHGSFQGTAQAFQSSLASEPLLIAAALITVYIVLGVLYESMIHPITILSTLPSAGVGALLALLLCSTDLSVIALIGIILLIGIVKKNAIMMIDFALEAERNEGKSPVDAILSSLRAALSPDHHDDAGGDARRLAAGARRRGRFGAAPPAGHRHRRRPDLQPDADALHDAGRVPLHGTMAALFCAAAASKYDSRPMRFRKMHDHKSTAMRALQLRAKFFRLAWFHRVHFCFPRAASAPTTPARRSPRRPATKKPIPRQPSPSTMSSKPNGGRCSATPMLNALEEQVDLSNQNVAQAEARYRQARALVVSARAAYFPTVTIGVGISRRARFPDDNPGPPSVNQRLPNTRLPIDVSWEIDVWGRIRRTVESNEANAQASAADLEAAKLSARAQLAQAYFLLRSVDAQKQLLDETVAAYQKSLELTTNRYNSGVASRGDVLQAETQLKTTQAQAIDTGVQRAQLEHAIALLIGKAPADLSIAARRSRQPRQSFPRVFLKKS